MVNPWTKFKDCEAYSRDALKRESKLKRQKVQTQIRLGLRSLDEVDIGEDEDE